VENTVLRRALRKHLLKVAAALHAIEWNDSGDGHQTKTSLYGHACSRQMNSGRPEKMQSRQKKISKGQLRWRTICSVRGDASLNESYRMVRLHHKSNFGLFKYLPLLLCPKDG